MGDWVYYPTLMKLKDIAEAGDPPPTRDTVL